MRATKARTPAKESRRVQIMRTHTKEAWSRLGRFARQRRFQLGLTQWEVAARVWRNPQLQTYVSRIERGEVRCLKYSVRKRLARVLKCKIHKLESLMEYPTPPPPRPPRTALARFICSLCEERGITRKELARRTGLSKARVRRLTTKDKKVTITIARLLVRALSCEPSEFRRFLQLPPNQKRPRTKLARMVREGRLIRLMAQEQLADYLEVSAANVSLIETDKVKLIQSRGDLVRRLCRKLGFRKKTVEGLIPPRKPYTRAA